MALDSGCDNYEQLWCTTSLRGLVGGTLSTELLTEGIHSGASGIVPCSFRVLRPLRSRHEDETTGRILAPEFYATIPEGRMKQASATAAALGDSVYREFPFVTGARPVSNAPAELILNRDWRPALSVIGADGLPPIANAGNVLRPSTTVKLSLRLPPTCDPRAATDKLKSVLEKDPPYRAKVSFQPDCRAAGWNAPELAPWRQLSLL